MYKRKKIIFITGGTGFIGSQLVYNLAKNKAYKIIALSRSKNKISDSQNVTYISGDILDKELITTLVKKADMVIHTAAIVDTAQTSVDIEHMFKVNINGTLNILNALKNSHVKFSIIFSSSSVYGKKVLKNIDETHPTNPISLYGASKLAAERLAYSFASVYNLPICIVRPFNVYGPGQYSHNVIPLFISQLINNENITLNNGGKQSRDFIYVNDVVNAINSLIKHRKSIRNGEVFNICSGSSYSIKFIAMKLKRLVGKPSASIKIEPFKQREVLLEIGNAKKLVKKYNWSPQIDIYSGLRKTIEWHISQI